MPLLFSYGSLQEEEVQLSTLGRRLAGRGDQILGFEQSFVTIDDPEVRAATGKTQHANLIYRGDQELRVAGMVFEVTEAELASIDEYEIAFHYERVVASLASGQEAWVYIELHGPGTTSIHEESNGHNPKNQPLPVV